MIEKKRVATDIKWDNNNKQSSSESSSSRSSSKKSQQASVLATKINPNNFDQNRKAHTSSRSISVSLQDSHHSNHQ